MKAILFSIELFQSGTGEVGTVCFDQSARIVFLALKMTIGFVVQMKVTLGFSKIL